MNRKLVGKAVFLMLTSGSISVASAAPNMSPPRTPVDQSTSESPASQHERHCNDNFFVYFPGYTAYCYGMKNWEAGEYRTGLHKIEKAAGWADKDAQYTLGMIYFNGHHVLVNRPLGLAWLLLAAERKEPQQFLNAAASADKIATPAERVQAVKLFKQMRLRYGDAYAARRAKMHYERAMRKTDLFTSVGGSDLCVAGLSTGSGQGALAPLSGAAAAGAAAALNHNLHGDCPSKSVFEKTMKKASKAYFEGLVVNGTVEVGPIEQGPVPEDKP